MVSKMLKKVLAGATLALALSGLFGVTAFAQGQTGIVTGNNLNLRVSPSTSASVISQLPKDTQVEVLETGDGWYKISIWGSTGWVSAQFLSVTDSSGRETGTISGNSVNVRTGPSTANDIIMAVVSGEKVSILEESNGWYKVEFTSGVVGWVRNDFVSTGSNSAVSRGDSVGTKLASFAKNYLGTKYVYGGSSTSGVDCSGFVKLVYNNFGLYVDRVAADQAKQGAYVDPSNLREGDLVFFDTDGGKNYINHVGIYIGNGQFIHASSGAGKVVINSIWDNFYSSSYMTARSLIR